MPQVVVLDESSSQHHPVKSVGGIVVRLDKLGQVEIAWRNAKQAAGLACDAKVKHSMSWADKKQRDKLIESIGKMDLKAVIAVLEDYRPSSYRLLKQKRSDLFIHKVAFKYVLQRLSKEQYAPPDTGAHFVMFDDCPEMSKHVTFYRDWWAQDQQFGTETLASLRTLGYSESLCSCHEGAFVEIADLVVSCMTRWLAMKCAAELGREVPDLTELESNATHLINLFPAMPCELPARRQGVSIIAHKDREKNVLYKHIDRWTHALAEGTS